MINTQIYESTNYENTLPIDERPQRSVFNIAQEPILTIMGSRPFAYLNTIVEIFCDGYAFDIGSPSSWSSAPNSPSYIFDMWWSIAATAYEAFSNDPYKFPDEYATMIYEAYRDNYHWYAPNVTAADIHRYGFKAPLTTFDGLRREEKLKFIFIAELMRLLRSNDAIIEMITREQKRVYAEFTLAAAEATMEHIHTRIT